jgi:hypothetical protein
VATLSAGVRHSGRRAPDHGGHDVRREGLPIVGAPHSSARGVWIAGMLFFMLAGAGGLVTAVEWLAGGEASRQFTWPHWLGGRRDEAA